MSARRQWRSGNENLLLVNYWLHVFLQASGRWTPAHERLSGVTGGVWQLWQMLQVAQKRGDATDQLVNVIHMHIYTYICIKTYKCVKWLKKCKKFDIFTCSAFCEIKDSERSCGKCICSNVDQLIGCDFSSVCYEYISAVRLA